MTSFFFFFVFQVLPYFLELWNIPDFSCIFPTPDLESAIFQRVLFSYFGKCIRNQYLHPHCHWDVTVSRCPRWKELGNICMHTNHVYTQISKCFCIYASVSILSQPWINTNVFTSIQYYMVNFSLPLLFTCNLPLQAWDLWLPPCPSHSFIYSTPPYMCNTFRILTHIFKRNNFSCTNQSTLFMCNL